jgi:hypothetical protein
MESGKITLICICIYVFALLPAAHAFHDSSSNGARVSDSGVLATLQDYWDRNASFVFQYAIPTASSCNPDSGEIIVLDGVWYRFARDFYNCATGNAKARILVEKSLDKGKIWTNKTVIVDNVPGSPYEYMAVDGDVFYDSQTNTWHYLFQCIVEGGAWNICHVSRVGRDPIGTFTADPSNPVIGSRDLWSRICDAQTDDCKALSPGGVWDEGTPDILKKVAGEYIVSFHGYDGVNGYRGIASTPDFVNWKIGNEAGIPLAADALFDKYDCVNWDSWDSGGCIGGGAADILEEDSYYYMFIEVADKNLAVQPGTRWDFGVVRSNSLADTSWEQKGTASVYSHLPESLIQYQKLFRDESGQVYMLYLRSSATAGCGYIEYLLKLEKSDDLALYQFREGSGDTTRSDLVRFGSYDASVYNVTWETSGGFDKKLKLNGRNSYVELPGHPEYDRNDTVFMEVKAKIDSAPSGKSALLAGKIGSYWAEIYPASMCFWINSEALGNVNTCVPLYDLIGIENTYQFLYNGSSLKMGVNGTQKASNNIGNSKIRSSAYNFRIGGPYPLTENYYGSFNGSVEYLRIAKNGRIDTTTTTTTTSSSTTSSTTTTSTSSTTTTTTTSSSTTTTTVPDCVMPGNYAPCGAVDLSEVVTAINQWATSEFTLGNVISLINSWADPSEYPPN